MNLNFELILFYAVMIWAHVNLHGEFDFRRHAANRLYFDLDKILQLAA